jgi:hypothetical protein
MASAATRSAANRPEASPATVRHTTGRPVAARAADQTSVATPGEIVNLAASPRMMNTNALMGRNSVRGEISGWARSLPPGSASAAAG